MEYIGTYKVRRQMHARPFTDMVNLINGFREPYSEMDIRVRNSNDSDKDMLPVNARSIMSLLAGNIGSVKGSSVDIIITGEYSVDELKECANRVGRLFETGEEYF